MQIEIALFWAVAAGFLVADNLMLLPAGRDYLRFGMRGRLVYSAATRIEAGGRELVMLNPLNLFHRAAVTTQGLGPLTVAGFRLARRQVAKCLPTLNTFAWLGYAYLVCAVGLASMSFAVQFASVLASFLATHLLFAVVSTILLVRRRKTLQLSSYQTLVFAVEALLVPAYTINMSKRLWTKQVLDLPAMSLGIRQARRTSDEFEREFALHQLCERLNLLSAGLDDESPGRRALAGQFVPVGLEQDQRGQSSERSQSELIRVAKACLTV